MRKAQPSEISPKVQPSEISPSLIERFLLCLCYNRKKTSSFSRLIGCISQWEHKGSGLLPSLNRNGSGGAALLLIGGISVPIFSGPGPRQMVLSQTLDQKSDEGQDKDATDTWLLKSSDPLFLCWKEFILLDVSFLCDFALESDIRFIDVLEDESFTLRPSLNQCLQGFEISAPCSFYRPVLGTLGSVQQFVAIWLSSLSRSLFLCKDGRVGGRYLPIPLFSYLSI